MILLTKYFNPLPPHGGRRTVCGKRFRIEKFQSTPSAWRETRLYLRLEVFFSYFNPLPPHGGRRTQRRAEASGRAISIHSLRMEGDKPVIPSSLRQMNFNPLPPHGGRPLLLGGFLKHFAFQSTPSAWRETNWKLRYSRTDQFQSTPSAWRETLRPQKQKKCLTNFNPLPPHGGRHADCEK